MINLLAASKALQVFIPALILLVLAMLFAIALAYLGKKLAVSRDERIDQVKDCLSGANCGACGYAGCDGFATALVEGKAELSSCNATSKEKKEEIAEILGLTDTGEATKVVVCCHGGQDAKDKYDYVGYGDCRSMELLAGGRKQCAWGCLGTGSCVDACQHHAVTVKQKGYSEVSLSKCISCGRCISVCPKKIIKRIPASATYYVACSNHQKGKEVRELCTKGCIACSICVKQCEVGAITIVDNLATIDYTKCINCGKCAAKCPQRCIVSTDSMK